MSNTTERRYKRIRIALMRNKVFIALSPVMRLGTQKLVAGYPTAGTDGVNETYGIEFIDMLEDKPLAFVIVHETMHKMARHMVTYRKLWAEDAALANHACDYWINGKLDTMAQTNNIIEMPRITQKIWDSLPADIKVQLATEGKGVGDYYGLLDHKYDGWTVKQIFDDLKQQQQGGGGGGGFDNHDWESAGNMTKEQQEAMRQEIERAIREGKVLAKKYGDGSANSVLGLDELLAPKVNWKDQLRQFVSSTCRAMQQSTWRRPNRRFLHQGIVMPTMQGKSIKSLGVCVDASGSMFCGSPTHFVKAMSEIEGLARQLKIDQFHLIYWDGLVCQHEQYTPSTITNWKAATQPRGGGGTNPACITPYLREHKITLDAAIVLTDGEVPEWGKWDVPVMFVVTGNAVANVGKTIHLKD